MSEFWADILLSFHELFKLVYTSLFALIIAAYLQISEDFGGCIVNIQLFIKVNIYIFKY